MQAGARIAQSGAVIFRLDLWRTAADSWPRIVSIGLRQRLTNDSEGRVFNMSDSTGIAIIAPFRAGLR
jgi:hypothetical protein